METQKEEKIREENLEVLFQKLESVIGEMEKEELSLEESFAKYQEGMEVLKECSKRVEYVEKQVMCLDEKGELHEF